MGSLVLALGLWLGFLGVDGPMGTGGVEETQAVWNRYETQNFEILSISKEQGVYLYQNIEFLRRWTLERWGIQSADFSVKCKVIVVPDRDSYVKLFRKEKPGFSIDRDKTGKIISSTIWLYAEPRWHVEILPRAVTEVALAEFEVKYSVTFPMWVHRGFGVLNTGVGSIKASLMKLGELFAKDNSCFWSKDLMTMTPERLQRYEEKYRAYFDNECAALCLYMVKERGVDHFTKVMQIVTLKQYDTVTAVRQIGFDSHEKFDLEFYRFMYGLSADLASRKTPDTYLTWPSNAFGKK